MLGNGFSDPWALLSSTKLALARFPLKSAANPWTQTPLSSSQSQLD